MLTVIFGAGASHGSAPPDGTPTGAKPPPLTSELVSSAYGDVATQFPASKPAILRLQRALRDRPGALIEAEMSALVNESDTRPEVGRHLVALRYYLSEVIEREAGAWWKALNGFTAYGELLDRLGSWRSTTGEPIALATFNYDVLLDESAVAQAGDWQLDTFESYIQRPDWRLYKLHGSTNWSRVIFGQVPGGNDDPANVIAVVPDSDLESGQLVLRPWRSDPPQSRFEIAEIAVPGIAVPTDLKRTFCCPESHVEALERDLGETDRLLIVGWRASEPHALELIRQTPIRQIAVCDVKESGARPIIRNLKEGGVTGHFWADLDFRGFTDMLRSGWLEQWLKS
jgi:hypothetical protein